ncbi:alpha/beta-hydrolase [Xylariaceae sp. FL0016]|nr:alpha/beta-hydrolase [Xylariaceae sp. FL0016]
MIKSLFRTNLTVLDANYTVLSTPAQEFLPPKPAATQLVIERQVPIENPAPPSSTMSATKTEMVFPSVEKIVQDEAFPTAIWQLEPHRSGHLPVAEGRGGPFKIHWEVHGDGPRKLILISGMGFFKTSYQRQTLHFGHANASTYSVLILDNRGMGRSDKPLMRYSTSEMARDLLEVVDHLGWTGERQLHVSGISMGGMIAQELGCLVPERIASLDLICTAAAIENTTGFVENLTNRITMLLPKSLDRTVQYAAGQIFVPAWLAEPDAAVLPDETLPRVKGGPYKRFADNYTRFAAQEVTKQRDVEGFTKKGFLMQVLAAGWHHKSPAQLKEMADRVGRERILVMHGTADRIIPIPHGHKLIRYLGLEEDKERGLIVESMGHAPVMERTEWYNGVLGKMCDEGERLSGR